MPTNLKAYIAILFISTIAFYFAKKITVPLVSLSQFKSWRNSWLIMTSIAFLSFNYWLFIALAFLYVAVKVSKEPNPAALYLALLCAVPPIPAKIPGFGIINYLIEINYPILLSIVFLLFVYFKAKTAYPKLKFGKVNTDIFIMLFILLNAVLYFRDTTVTDTLRQTTRLFLTIFLPYYFLSRYVQTIAQFKAVFSAFIIVCIPAALIGIFEKLKGWLLYSALAPTLGADWGFGGYLLRDSSLRATSAFGHSIAFGYVMTVALGVYLCLQTYINNKLYRNIGYAILGAGLLSALARGPWVGAAIMICTFLYLGRNAISNLFRLGMLSLVFFAILLTLPVGKKIINLLPFIGNVDQFNVDYRQQLIDTSIIVIARTPWFGNKNFDQAPEMQSMYQGEQIIDIVNQYINVLLNSGYVGLSLFLMIFLSAMIMPYRAMKKIKSKNNELHILGRSLIAIMMAIMVMITAVGDVLIVPYIYYIFIGLCIAYAQMVKRELLILNSDNNK